MQERADLSVMLKLIGSIVMVVTIIFRDWWLIIFVLLFVIFLGTKSNTMLFGDRLKDFTWAMMAVVLLIGTINELLRFDWFRALALWLVIVVVMFATAKGQALEPNEYEQALDEGYPI